MANLIKENDIAPDFTLPDESGNLYSLKHFAGKKIILYFYPKDNTPGCTKEACGFRDNYSEITDKGAVVIGISKDNAKSHQKFKLKYNLPFILLSDENADIIKKYDAWGEKSMYGKKYFGTLRKTYIIDENGKIIKIFSNVTPQGHAQEILEYL